jgi:hypothetical protein
MDEIQLAEIARQIVEGEILYSWRFYLIFFCLAFLATAASSFLVPYFRTRGKRYATKADFDSLLNELRETTKATEGIKQEISHGTWIKQRNWELRRETYLKLVAKFHKLQAIDGLRLAELDAANRQSVPEQYAQFIQRITGEHFDQQLETHELIATAMAVGSSNAKAVLMDYWIKLLELSTEKVSEENVRELIANSQELTATTFAAFLQIAQNELSEVT